MLFESNPKPEPVPLMVELLTLEESQEDDPEIQKTVFIGVRNGVYGIPKKDFTKKFGYTVTDIREAYEKGVTTLHLGKINGTEFVIWISEKPEEVF